MLYSKYVADVFTTMPVTAMKCRLDPAVCTGRPVVAVFLVGLVATVCKVRPCGSCVFSKACGNCVYSKACDSCVFSKAYCIFVYRETCGS
jgi:hypothetical protein